MSGRRVVASLLHRSSQILALQSRGCPMVSVLAAFTQQASPSTVEWARSLSSSAAPCMSSALAAALKDEVKHESKEYSRPDIVASGPPAPFVLQETPGDTLLTLTRDFNGETVSVDLQVNNQPEADDFTEGGEDGGADGAALAINSVAFNVAVRRAGGKHQLVFDCESNGNEVLIMHVSHEPVGGAAPEEKPFTGPVFSELDEALIREFRAYLTERGVDADLGEYLRHLVHDKEQREYAAWLQRTHDFVAKK